MIVDRLAPTRPDLALDLMWRFMDLAEPVIERVDDSNGSVGGVFRSEALSTTCFCMKEFPECQQDEDFSPPLHLLCGA